MANRKGIVVEAGKGWAIILTENGEYQKIKTSEFLQVGEQYQDKFRLPLSYIAAAIILLALSLTSLDYYSVKAYAQIPSVGELGVNRWGRVVSVQANHEVGQDILNTVELKNNRLEVAVEKIYKQSLKEGGDNQTHKLEILITGTDNKEKLEDKMLRKIDQGLKQAEQIRKKTNSLKQNNYDQNNGLDNKEGKDIEETWENKDWDIDDFNLDEYKEKIQEKQERGKEKIDKKPNWITKEQLPPLEFRLNYNSYKNYWDNEENNEEDDDDDDDDDDDMLI